jgi:hypothetical protein
MERVATPQMITGLSQRLGVDKSKVKALAIHNHEQSLKDDIERVRSSSLIPRILTSQGYFQVQYPKSEGDDIESQGDIALKILGK